MYYTPLFWHIVTACVLVHISTIYIISKRKRKNNHQHFSIIQPDVFIYKLQFIQHDCGLFDFQSHSRKKRIRGNYIPLFRKILLPQLFCKGRRIFRLIFWMEIKTVPCIPHENPFKFLCCHFQYPIYLTPHVLLLKFNYLLWILYAHQLFFFCAYKKMRYPHSIELVWKV